jgi:hypothetical protein
VNDQSTWLLLERVVPRIMRLGPRVFSELLVESAKEGDVDLMAFLKLAAEYADNIDPIALRLAGGDLFVPRRLHLVPR